MIARRLAIYLGLCRRYGVKPVVGCHLVWPQCIRALFASRPKPHTSRHTP